MHNKQIMQKLESFCMGGYNWKFSRKVESGCQTPLSRKISSRGLPYKKIPVTDSGYKIFIMRSRKQTVYRHETRWKIDFKNSRACWSRHCWRESRGRLMWGRLFQMCTALQVKLHWGKLVLIRGIWSRLWLTDLNCCDKQRGWSRSWM